MHEKTSAAVGDIYPDGIHAAIAEGLADDLGSAVRVRTATLEEPEHGLTDEVLAGTDVLSWWGHAAHDRVADAVVERVQKHVLGGMGLLVLHSAHASKIFKRLLGTSCMLRWREAGERERLWIVDPSHPIAEGLEGEYFELDQTEMYGEFFDVPRPTRSSSSVGSRAARCFAPAARSGEARARCSTSVPATKPFPSTAIQTSAASSPTPSAGSRRPALRTSAPGGISRSR